MTPRAFLVVAASIGLVACFARTTSLGEADTTRAGVSADEEDAGEAGNAPSQPTESGGLKCEAQGYTWIPEPTEVPCVYLLPPTDPPQNDDPRLSPATWNTNAVVVDVFVPNEWEDQGYFKRTSEDCEGLDGWFYVDFTDAAPPTRFGLCPKSCASVQAGALLRLSAHHPCD
jgi:hypothetical protein